VARGWERHAFGEVKNQQTWDSRKAELKPEFEDVTYGLCGVRLYRHHSVSTDPLEINCTKCSAKFAKIVLVGHPTLRLEKVQTEAFKSCNAAYDGDELLGYVVFEAGFGGSWKIRGITLDADQNLTWERAYPHMPAGNPDLNRGEYSSKEAALLAARIFVDRGIILNATQTMQKRIADRDYWAAKTEKRRARRQAKLRRDEEVFEGLKSIYDRREAVGLTNFEVDALLTAMDSVDTPEEGDDD
jgi:hypothetical protein